MRSVIVPCLLIIIFTGFAFTAYAEQINTTDSSRNSYGNSIFQIGQKPLTSLRSMSLLDPERFTMKQQTIFNYSSSGNYGSSMMGMYVNTMEYRFNMPLTMRLRVAYQNNMSGLFSDNSSMTGRSGQETGNLFIPSFDMIYQPWRNTTISFHYRDFSGMDQYSDPNYYRRYGRFGR